MEFLRSKMRQIGPDARIRVNLKYGYISYSIQDFDKALQIFNDEGQDILLCEDIYDDGKSVFPRAADA